jgi:hypothetical protein
MSLYEDPTIARLIGLVLKVLEKGPASTAQLHRSIVTELDNVPALSQSQSLRLLHEMERSGSVRSSGASQTHLVWELAPRSK